MLLDKKEELLDILKYDWDLNCVYNNQEIIHEYFPYIKIKKHSNNINIVFADKTESDGSEFDEMV